MLAPEEFTTGTFASAPAGSLILPRNDREVAAIVGIIDAAPAVVILSGQFQYHFSRPLELRIGLASSFLTCGSRSTKRRPSILGTASRWARWSGQTLLSASTLRPSVRSVAHGRLPDHGPSCHRRGRCRVHGVAGRDRGRGRQTCAPKDRCRGDRAMTNLIGEASSGCW
jgi:hypothetical protein